MKAKFPSALSSLYERYGSFFFQAALCFVVAFLLYGAYKNAAYNIKENNIATGFSFLWDTAGFDVSQSLIPYDTSATYGRFLLVGLLNTALVAVLGIVGATILGFLLGVARLSKNWCINRLALVYVEVVRNVPLLLQIFVWYYPIFEILPSVRESLSPVEGVYINSRGFYLPSLVAHENLEFVLLALIVGAGLALLMRHIAWRQQTKTGRRLPVIWINFALVVGLPLCVFFLAGRPMSLALPELGTFDFEGGMVVQREFCALFLALATYTAAFIAEIVRAGILSVGKGQLEAAASLGMPWGRSLQLIIIPQAMRVILPPLTSQYLNLTKNSSLGVAIGYPDLVNVFAGTTLNLTGQAVEVLLITLLVYLSLSVFTSIAMNIYNARVRFTEK